MTTLPIWFFNNFARPNNLPIVNAVAVFVIVLSMIPVYLANRLSSAEPVAAGRGGRAPAPSERRDRRGDRRALSPAHERRRRRAEPPRGTPRPAPSRSRRRGYALLVVQPQRVLGGAGRLAGPAGEAENLREIEKDISMQDDEPAVPAIAVPPGRASRALPAPASASSRAGTPVRLIRHSQSGPDSSSIEPSSAKASS